MNINKGISRFHLFLYALATSVSLDISSSSITKANSPLCLAAGQNSSVSISDYTNELKSLNDGTIGDFSRDKLDRWHSCMVALATIFADGYQLNASDADLLLSAIDARDEYTNGYIYTLLMKYDGKLQKHFCLLEQGVEKTKAYILKTQGAVGTIRLANYGYGTMRYVVNYVKRKYGEENCKN